jgi:hypothetical protein
MMTQPVARLYSSVRFQNALNDCAQITSARRTVVGALFNDQHLALRALRALQANDVRGKHVGIAIPQNDHHTKFAHLAHLRARLDADTSLSLNLLNCYLGQVMSLNVSHLGSWIVAGTLLHMIRRAALMHLGQERAAVIAELRAELQRAGFNQDDAIFLEKGLRHGNTLLIVRGANKCLAAVLEKHSGILNATAWN